MRDGRTLELTTLQRAMVIALALHPAGLSWERLADLIYSQNPPASAQAAIKVHVFRLRRRIDRRLIETRGFRYLLGPTIRVIRPDEQADLSPQRLADMTVDQLQELARRSLPLRSAVPDELEYYDWYSGVIVRYQQSGRDLALRLCRELASRSLFTEAISIATELTRADGCDEEAWELIIRCHLSQGERAAAIHGFRFLRMSLQKDLGLSPSNSLLQLLHN